MAAGMPWIPANMTEDRRRRLEAFANYRRISRAEAAGLLIDAGIEALRPVVSQELQEQRAAIAKRALPRRSTAGMGHNVTDARCMARRNGEASSPLAVCVPCSIERNGG